MNNFSFSLDEAFTYYLYLVLYGEAKLLFFFVTYIPILFSYQPIQLTITLF